MLTIINVFYVLVTIACLFLAAFLGHSIDTKNKRQMFFVFINMTILIIIVLAIHVFATNQMELECIARLIQAR